jgi:fumarate reductase subunit D
MAKSNKPIVWAPFAAGGTITALATPAIVVLTLLAALGQTPPALTYDGLRAFLASGIAKAIVVGVVALSLWSCAHRLRITFYDLGVRADALVATIMYLAAGLGTAAALLYLMQL